MPYFLESAEEDSASELYSSNSGGSSGEEDCESAVHERKRKIRIGRERERKWLNHGDKALKTCRHFSYSLIECAWKFEWEAQQVADLLTLIIDELALDRAATMHMLLKSESVDIEIITCLMDRGMNFTTEDILNILQQSTSDAIRFCKAIGEALDQGLLTLRDDETLEAICRFPSQKNFSFNAVSCLVSLLVEYAPTKSLYGRCFAILTECLSPQDIAGLGIKVVGSYVFRELKGTLDSFLSQISCGRNELEIQINSKYHRDSGGEILESDEDSEGNLKDFVVDDDVLIMDTSAEEDGSDEEEEYENEEEEDDDDNSVSLVGDDGKNMDFYRSVDMKHRKNNREEDGLWNTQPSPATKKEKKESKKRLRQDEQKRTKRQSSKDDTPLFENGNKEKKKKRFDLESSDEDIAAESKPSFLPKKPENEKKSNEIVSLDTSPEKSVTKSKKLNKHVVKDVVSLISPPETLEKVTKTKNNSKGNVSEDDEEFDMTKQNIFHNKAKPIKKNAAIRIDESDEEENDNFQQQRIKKQVDAKQSSDSDSSSSTTSVPVTKKVRRDLTSLFPSLPASSQAASQVLPLGGDTIGVSKKPVEDVLDFSPVKFSPSQEHLSHHKRNHSSPVSTNHHSKSSRHKSPHEMKASPSKKGASQKGKSDKQASTKFMPAEEEDDDVIDDDEEESNTRKPSKKHHRKHHKHTPDKHPAEYYDF